MPVPVVVWAALALGAAALGAANLRGANKRILSIRRKYERRRQRYEQFTEQFERFHQRVSSDLRKLGELRLGALVTLGEAVAFLEQARLKQRDLSAKFHITPQRILHWRNASIGAREVASGLTQATMSGVATASGVYGLVGVLASASTGTAISALSGAAATNATLAWLGGGAIAAGGGGVAAGTMVLGGLVVGPAIAAAGFVANAKAEKVETEIERYIAELDRDQAEKEKARAILTAVRKRIRELTVSTQTVQSELVNLIEKCSPALEVDAFLVAKTAASLGDLLEVAILDKSGNPIEEKRRG